MRKRIGLAVLTVAAMSAAAWLGSCGGAPPKPTSLLRTYALVDDEGRKAGTVVFNPMGGGEVRDADGTVIGIISAPAAKAAPAPAPTPAPEKAPEPEKK